MFWSNYFIPTLKDTASEDAQVISNSLMLKSGMIRKNASGIYTWLPLGLRVLNKVENIVREEMNNAGAHEVLMPMVQPKDLWNESKSCLLYTSPSPRDVEESRMPSSA